MASSYAAAFRPYAMPAVGHAHRLIDGSLWHDGEYVQLPKAEECEDRDYRATCTVSLDAGGGFVRDRDGRIIRDRLDVTRHLRRWPELQRIAPWTLARRLLFADLQPMLGTHRAARRLLAWDDDLGAPWRTPGASDVVSRFEAGGALGAEEKRRLKRAEQTMIRSCRRSPANVGRAT